MQDLKLPGIWGLIEPLLLRKATLESLKNAVMQWLEAEAVSQPVLEEVLKTLDQCLDVVIQAVGK